MLFDAGRALWLMVALALLADGCEGKRTIEDAGQHPESGMEDAKIDAKIDMFVDTLGTECPADPQQGDTCAVSPATECASKDPMAFSCGLQICRCKQGTFACEPFWAPAGTPCAPFGEGDGCSLEGQPACDLGPPSSGSYDCKSGKWVLWSSCHDQCPYSYEDSMQGSSCSFSPQEGQCTYWNGKTCTCKNGQYECS